MCEASDFGAHSGKLIGYDRYRDLFLTLPGHAFGLYGLSGLAGLCGLNALHGWKGRQIEVAWMGRRHMLCARSKNPFLYAGTS